MIRVQEMKHIVHTLQVAGGKVDHSKDWKYAIDLLLVVPEGLLIVIRGLQ
jgi:hypothetical protein